MLTDKEYVPVLRWKQAEWLALRFLGEDVRGRITPLLEIPPSCFAPREKETTVDIHSRLDAAVRQIARSWGDRPFFLELSLLKGMGDAANSQLLVDAEQLCRERSLRMIPVTGLGRGSAYQDAVRECAGKSDHLCLRIGCAEARSAAIDRVFGAGERRAGGPLRYLEVSSPEARSH